MFKLLNEYMLLKFFLIIFIIILSTAKAENLKNCEWKNNEGKPCLTIKKTPNSSIYSEIGINKQIITKQDIIDSGAIDSNDILNLVSGLDVFQSGPKGQSTSIFTRGSESNHTLVLINGIAINDQSVTDWLPVWLPLAQAWTAFSPNDAIINPPLKHLAKSFGL